MGERAGVIVAGSGAPGHPGRAAACLALPLADGALALVDAGDGPAVVARLAALGLDPARVAHIVLTHDHPDHVGGLAALLAARGAAPPPTLHAFPDVLADLPATLALAGLPPTDGAPGGVALAALIPGRPTRLGDLAVTAHPADHTVPCAALRLAWAGSATVVAYATDTRPCAGAVAAARGATVLLHDAFGSARHAGAAALLGHSDGAGAGATARRAGAGRVLLTHLRALPADDEVAMLAEARAAFGGPVALAADGLTVSIGRG
jgi:ribonuclease BN (tRNA processing enzyme)